MSCVDGVVYRALAESKLQQLTAFKLGYSLHVGCLTFFIILSYCFKDSHRLPGTYQDSDPTQTVHVCVTTAPSRTIDEVVPIIWVLTWVFHQTQCRSSLLPSLAISTGPSVFLLASVKILTQWKKYARTGRSTSTWLSASTMSLPSIYM